MDTSISSILEWIPGTDPGFQVRGGALKKIAPSGRRRENVWGISCEKSRFYAKKSYFFPILEGGHTGCRPSPRVFTNQWWRQIRRPFICHFAIWLFLPLVVCSHILHTVVPITVTLQSSTSWDLIDVCEWMSNLDLTFWDWEKWNQLVYNTWWSYRFSGAMLCCLVQAGRQRNRANSQVADNKDYWRIILYY